MTFKKGEVSNPNGKPRIYTIPTPWNKKYSYAKSQAKYRNEEWAFTDETWYELWKQSGVMEHMGRQPHQYCMVRKDEIEAWGPHNCIIISRRMHLKKTGYTALQHYPNAPWEDKHGV